MESLIKSAGQGNFELFIQRNLTLGMDNNYFGRTVSKDSKDSDPKKKEEQKQEKTPQSSQ